MFAELPKLFDRNFAIGFFLPFALAAAAGLYLLDTYGLSGFIPPAWREELVTGGAIFGLFSWLGGILLLVTNRDLYRILEGYGRVNPLRFFAWLERAYYHRLNDKLRKLDDEFRAHVAAGIPFPEGKRAGRDRLMVDRSERFPDRESLILPTPFGNILRAFESYPRVMYGLESIDGWSRLLAVVPVDYRNLIDGAKANVDLWVNLAYLSLLLLVGELGLWCIYGVMPPPWLLAITALVLVITPWRARRLAVEWGDYVKGAFDLYRFNLLDLLSIRRPRTRQEEFQIWESFSQAIVYRLPKRLPELRQPARNLPASRNNRNTA